jgi:hypothetical protein
LERHLSASQVERILRRASELADDGHAGDLGGISEPALIAAAEEAGIPGRAVRRAIAMETLGEPPAGQRADRLVGPRIVTVDVELPMSVPEAMSRLDVWMISGHHLRRERWSAYEAEWRRRDGIIAAGTRAIRHATGEGSLGDVRSLIAVARETDDGALLRVRVDRTADRAAWIGGGSAVATMSAGAALVGAVAVVPVLALFVPVGLAAGAGVARIGRSHSEKLDREAQRVLAAIESRMQPTSIRGDFVRWAIQRPRRRV